MVISQGEIWWADLPEPNGSGPGFRKPVVVVQGDALNRSRIGTVVCAADQQPEVVRSAWKRVVIDARYRAPEGIGGERLPDFDFGQGASHGANWQNSES